MPWCGIGNARHGQHVAVRIAGAREQLRRLDAECAVLDGRERVVDRDRRLIRGATLMVTVAGALSSEPSEVLYENVSAPTKFAFAV